LLGDCTSIPSRSTSTYKYENNFYSTCWIKVRSKMVLMWQCCAFYYLVEDAKSFYIPQ
jgi:hypothetical protein